MSRLDKSVEKYLLAVMNNPKASTDRRDKAAERLARNLANKRRYLLKKLGAKKGYSLTGGNGKGKKAERREIATEVAATCDEWSDLIPKAKVISILDKRRATK